MIKINLKNKTNKHQKKKKRLKYNKKQLIYTKVITRNYLVN